MKPNLADGGLNQYAQETAMVEIIRVQNRLPVKGKTSFPETSSSSSQETLQETLVPDFDDKSPQLARRPRAGAGSAGQQIAARPFRFYAKHLQPGLHE
jgi:hypothetical protein